MFYNFFQLNQFIHLFKNTLVVTQLIAFYRFLQIKYYYLNQFTLYFLPNKLKIGHFTELRPHVAGQSSYHMGALLSGYIDASPNLLPVFGRTCLADSTKFSASIMLKFDFKFNFLHIFI